MSENWFGRFAEWCQRKIASPRHLIIFLLVTVVWVVWASTRQWDAFAQLVLNTPTTWAEYVFEILVLAAGLRAGDLAEQVLTAMLSNERKILDLEARIEETQAEQVVELKQQTVLLKKLLDG